jgi:hypothetical protein
MSGRVYFAKHGERIKIGYTGGKVAARLRDIGAHLETPIGLLGDIPGDISVERQLHAKLASVRLKGEWFKDCELTRGVINAAMLSPPAPVVRTKSPTITLQQAPESVPGSTVVVPKTPAEYGAMLRRMADEIWPNEAILRMAALSEQSIEVVREWFEGKAQAPKPIVHALAYEFLVHFFPHVGAPVISEVGS